MGVVPVLLRVKTPARWLLAKAILMGETCRPEAPALPAAKANIEEKNRPRNSAAETRNKEANIMNQACMHLKKQEPEEKFLRKEKSGRAESRAAAWVLIAPTADARGREQALRFSNSS